MVKQRTCFSVVEDYWFSVGPDDADHTNDSLGDFDTLEEAKQFIIGYTPQSCGSIELYGKTGKLIWQGNPDDLLIPGKGWITPRKPAGFVATLLRKPMKAASNLRKLFRFA